MFLAIIPLLTAEVPRSVNLIKQICATFLGTDYWHVFYMANDFKHTNKTTKVLSSPR